MNDKRSEVQRRNTSTISAILTKRMMKMLLLAVSLSVTRCCLAWMNPFKNIAVRGVLSWSHYHINNSKGKSNIKAIGPHGGVEYVNYSKNDFTFIHATP